MNAEFYPLSIGAGFNAGRSVEMQKSTWIAAYIIQVDEVRHKAVSLPFLRFFMKMMYFLLQYRFLLKLDEFFMKLVSFLRN